MTGAATPGACAALLVGAPASPLAGPAPARPDGGPREGSRTVGASARAAGLREASLCLREVDSVELGLPGAPLWLTPAWLRAWLADALTGRACSDITSLIYVFLERGGTLTPIR